MPCGVSLKNVQSLELNCIFFRFKVKLLSLAVSNRVNKLPSCSTSFLPCVKMSSVIPKTPSNSLKTLSSLSWKTVLDSFNPNVSLSHLIYTPRQKTTLQIQSDVPKCRVCTSSVKYIDCDSSGKCLPEFYSTICFTLWPYSSLLKWSRLSYWHDKFDPLFMCVYLHDDAFLDLSVELCFVCRLHAYWYWPWRALHLFVGLLQPYMVWSTWEATYSFEYISIFSEDIVFCSVFCPLTQ